MKKLIITILIVLSTILILSGCTKQKIEKQIKYVKIMTIKNSAPNLNVDYTGTVISRTKTYLGFKVSGRINNIYVKTGQYIKKGKIIASVSNISYSLQFESAKAKLSQAKSSEENAKRELLRVEKLYITGGTSKNTLDSMTTKYKYLKAEVVSVEKQVDILNQELKYTKLIMPYSGYVSVKLKTIGENISPATPVFIITTKNNKDLIELNISSNVIYKLKLNQKVSIDIPELNLNGINGKIYSIGTIPTAIGNTYSVKIEIIKNIKNLRVGMFSNVKIFFNSNIKKILIPIGSTTKINNVIGVFVVSENLKSQKYFTKFTKIVLGQIYSNGVEIKSGLNINEKIVVAGIDYLHSGQEVKLLKE